MSNAVIQSKHELLAVIIIAFMPIIKKSIDASRIKNFDEKLQRSYFLVGKK